MKYRKIPKTGDNLSILGFGLMRLPEKRGRIETKKAEALLFQAIEKGVNYFDTAMPYHMGASESFLGKALQGSHRQNVKIATKLPPWSVIKKSDMDTLFTLQLQKLKTDYIDYYLLHALNGDAWNKMKNLGVLDFLYSLKSQGKIINAGFSFHGDKNSFKEIVDGFDWEFCQIQYNYLDEQNQAGKEGLEYAAEKNLGIIVMEPLRGGNLAKKPPEDVQKLWNSSKEKREPVEWALKWIWNHPEVTVVLSGMNDRKQMDQNIKIAEQSSPGSFTSKELEIVSGVEKIYRKRMKAGCTGCRYCMPCPAGVDIPACFEFYNSYHTFDDRMNSKLFYLANCGGLFSGKSALASLCEECGKCEKLCPQELPISNLLKDVARHFETFQFKVMLRLVKVIFKFQQWKNLRKQ